MSLQFNLSSKKALNFLPLISYFIIPWGYALMNIASILLLLYAVFNVKKIKSHARLFKKAHLIYTTLFALYLVLAVLLTTPHPFGENIFKLMLYLIFLPPVVYASSIISEEDNSKYFNAFKLSVFIFCIASFVVIGFNNIASISDGFMSLITHKALSTVIVSAHSPYYLSLMVLIAKVISLEELYNQKNKILNTLIFTTLFIVLILLSTRTAIILGVMIVVFYVFRTFKNIFQRLVMISIVASLFIGVSLENKVLQKRIANTMKLSFNNLNWQEDWAYQGLAFRYQIWDCAIQSLEDNLVFGVGPTKVNEQIKKCYTEKKYHALIWFNENRNSSFNSHNMYLEVMLMGGIIGAIIFMFMTWKNGVFLFKQTSPIQKQIFIIFIILFITESILSRNIGIILFSFFIYRFNFIKKTA